MVQTNKKRYDHKSNNKSDYNRANHVPKVNNPTFKISGNCYVCGKPGHKEAFTDIGRREVTILRSQRQTWLKEMT